MTKMERLLLRAALLTCLTMSCFSLPLLDIHRHRRHYGEPTATPIPPEKQMPRQVQEISKGTLDFIKTTHKIRPGPFDHKLMQMPYHRAGLSSTLRKVLFPTDFVHGGLLLPQIG